MTERREKPVRDERRSDGSRARGDRQAATASTLSGIHSLEHLGTNKNQQLEGSRDV